MTPVCILAPKGEIIAEGSGVWKPSQNLMQFSGSV